MFNNQNQGSALIASSVYTAYYGFITAIIKTEIIYFGLAIRVYAAFLKMGSNHLAGKRRRRMANTLVGTVTRYLNLGRLDSKA